MLGCNIGHMTTVLNAGGTDEPDRVQAAFIAEHAGADAITVHLTHEPCLRNDRAVHRRVQLHLTLLTLDLLVTSETSAVPHPNTAYSFL
ncbi:pyridoxine 5'-phosphate synthase, partial [Salmonella enterica]|uniref:pyridoxine 5'-phosphate synthase n=1 Tax=Salmonella enterica TaxID=28901 RepID=UPI00398C7B65